jgi:3-oxoadipate enol-lactonase
MIPIVFLHGVGGSARSFAPQIASFAARGYQPVALDLLGYGGRAPVDTITFDALAADVEASIAKSALEKPVLAGHSMGGMVVQTLLRRRPDGYRAAVLSCTSPAFGNPSGDFQKKFVADRLAPLDAGKTMAQNAPAAADGIMGPQPDPAGRALFIEDMRRCRSGPIGRR